MLVGINQKIAPIRLCFFIPPDSESSFLNAIKVAYSTWGGMLAPIIPFYEELPEAFRKEFQIPLKTSEYYFNTVSNFDPDIIIYETSLNKRLVEERADGRRCMTFDEFTQRSSSSFYHYGVSLGEIAEHVAGKEFQFVRADGLKISIPQFADNEVFLKAHYGYVDNDVQESVSALFENLNCVQIDSVTWADLQARRSLNILDIRMLNCYKIRLWRNHRIGSSSMLYFFKSKRLQDVINFWNLRAAGVAVVPIPVDAPTESLPYFEELFKEFCKGQVEEQNKGLIVFIYCLIGYSCDGESIIDTWRKKFSEKGSQDRVQFSLQSWFPRYWGNLRVTHSDQIKSHTPYLDTHFDHYPTDGDTVELSRMPLPFDLHNDLYIRPSSYKVILEMNLHDEYAEYAGVVAGIDSRQARLLLNMFSSSELRLSHSQFHISVHSNDTRIRLNLIKASEYFRVYYNGKGFKLTETVNSKLAREVLKNIGGVFGASLFLRNGPLKIIELFEGGEIVSYSYLLGELKRNLGNKENHHFYIERLIENRIVEFGAQVKCKICEQKGFYLMPQFLESVTCPICRNHFSLPMNKPSEITWAYRGIGPFSRTNKADGVMAVFATLRLFTREISDSSGRMSVGIGVELEKTGRSYDGIKHEVDISIMLGDRFDELQAPDHLLCECKTYKYFTEIDIERMKALADKFPGAILVFATLNPELTADEKELMVPFVKHCQRGRSDRPENPVLILTGKELLPEQYGGAFSEYQQEIRGYHHNDFLGSLCELSIKKHLNIPNWGEIIQSHWIEEVNRTKMLGAIIAAIQDYKNSNQQ